MPARWLVAPSNCKAKVNFEAAWGTGAAELRVWKRNGDQAQMWKSWACIGRRTGAPVSFSLPLRKGEEFAVEVVGDGDLEARMWVLLTALGTSGQQLPILQDTTFNLLHLQADSLELNDGDPVAEWDDDSGAGNHVSESEAGRQPTFVAAGLNGLPVVRFDGSDDRLRRAEAVGTVQPYTGFVVARSTATTFGNFREMVGTYPGGGVRGGEIGITETSGDFHAIAGPTVDGGLVYGAADTAWHIHEAVFDGVGSVYAVDGDEVFGDVGTAAFDGELIVGAAFTDGHEGDIAEVGYFSRALTDSERSEVRQALADKWGLT